MLSLNITTTRWPIRNLLRIALTRNGKTYDIFVVYGTLITRESEQTRSFVMAAIVFKGWCKMFM